MTRDEAEHERKRLAEEDPETTWIVAEGDDGWQVLKVGIPPVEAPAGTAIAAKPKPPQPDDPRTAARKNVGPGYG